MATIFLTSSDKSRSESWQTVVAKNVKTHQLVVEKTFRNLSRIKPDLCLLDIDAVHDIDEAEISQLIAAQKETKFIILVAVPEAEGGLAWIRAGAKAYLNRLSHPTVLLEAIETVINGEIWAGRQVVQLLLQKLQHSPDNPKQVQFEKLTDREHELALLVASGLSNNQAAGRLGVKERTVKAHLSNIFKKLKIKSRLQLALLMKQEHPRQVKKSVV